MARRQRQRGRRDRSLDIAATDFGRGGCYTLARGGRSIDSDGLAEMLLGWLARYPRVALEDPLAEDGPDGLRQVTAAAGPCVGAGSFNHLPAPQTGLELVCRLLLVKKKQKTHYHPAYSSI